MAEILLHATDFMHPNPIRDRMCWKRGMVVGIYEDGKCGEALRDERGQIFALIKIPGIAAVRCAKFIEPFMNADGSQYKRRLWQVRWADLPAAAKSKLIDPGILIIKAGTYSGGYDYTWEQVRQFFRNIQTGADEGGEL